MKTNQLMIAAMMVLLMPATVSASGKSQDALSRSVSEDLTVMSQSLETEWDELSREEEPSDEATQRWYFQQFRVRLQGKVGVEVPWLAGLEIVPEVEMVFQRTSPEGWTSYKP